MRSAGNIQRNPRLLLILVLLIFAGPLSVRSQIAFTNLSFECGRAIRTADGYDDWNLAMPGWRGYVDTYPVDRIQVVVEGGSGVMETTLTLLSYPTFPNALFDGINLLFLGKYQGSAAIAQTATLPTNAALVTFWTVPTESWDPMGVWITVDGVQIGLDHLATISTESRPSGGHSPYGIKVWGGNVSHFAGRTCELRLNSGWDGGVSLDNIRFYPTNAPHGSLKIAATVTNTVVLTWAEAYPGSYTVEMASDLLRGPWSTIPEIPYIPPGGTQLILPVPTASTFYRLKPRAG